MKHILLVEDHADTAELLIEILKEKGFEVTPVWNGELALEALINSRFDAVILDVHLPKLDGIEVLKQADKQARLNGTAVICMSADNKALKVPLEGVYKLPKPFGLEDLDTVLALSGVM